MSEVNYAFKVGQEVNVYQDWEQPRYTGTVRNRRYRCKGVGADTNYVKEYLVTDKYGAEEAIYEEHELKEVSK